jgi:hypothetical protein
LIIEDYERKRWPIEPPDTKRSVTAWKPADIPKPISAACSARDSAHPTS